MLLISKLRSLKKYNCVRVTLPEVFSTAEKWSLLAWTEHGDCFQNLTLFPSAACQIHQINLAIELYKKTERVLKRQFYMYLLCNSLLNSNQKYVCVNQLFGYNARFHFENIDYQINLFRGKGVESMHTVFSATLGTCFLHLCVLEVLLPLIPAKLSNSFITTSILETQIQGFLCLSFL